LAVGSSLVSQNHFVTFLTTALQLETTTNRTAPKNPWL